jgi:hypothetical protein
MTHPKLPIPKARNSFSALDRLKVGDYATFPKSSYDSIGMAISIRGRTLGFKYTKRADGDIVRVWRTA